MPSHTDQLPTVIGPDTLVKGEIIAQTAAHILGKVEGKVTSQGQLLIGAGSVCKASVQGVTVIIEGTVEGNVLAIEKLELKPTAIIRGDITTARLLVSEGASFTGQCSVGAEAVTNAQTRTQTHPANDTIPAHTRSNGSRPAVNIPSTGSDVDSALAGLEAKLAGFTKSRAAAAATSNGE